MRALGIGLGAALVVVALQAILPWLPVMGGIHFAAPAPGEQSMRFEPGEYVNSLSWDLREPVHGRINQQGFLSPFDYRPDQPAVGLFGDSFVEGLMVPFAQSLPAQIQGQMQETGAAAATSAGATSAGATSAGAAGALPAQPPLAAYNFGQSGASLPHYLGLGREVSARYDLKAAVIVITPGDYDEGFHALEGQYQWGADPAGPLVEGEAPRVRTGWKASARKLALVRYLRQNLLVENLPLFRHPMAADPCADGGLSAADEARLRRYVAELPQALRLDPARIVIVFNHNPYAGVIYDPIDRPKVAAAAAAHPCPSHDSLALARLATLASQAGIRIVDNTAMLQDEYRRERKLLDFTPVDRHWNARAIEMTAGAVVAQLRQP